MFIVFLKFSHNQAKAGDYMEPHKAWIKSGLESGTFLLVGSLKPNKGGCIIAHNTSREELDAKINQDPFVIENIVSAEIHEISPAMANDQLAFLLE